MTLEASFSDEENLPTWNIYCTDIVQDIPESLNINLKKISQEK